MILLLANVALAKIDCSGGSVTDTVPAPGATGVPIDIRLAALVIDAGCLTGVDWAFTLTRADSGALVAEATAAESELVATGLGELFPPVLDPLTAYVFTVEQDFLVAEVGFTTGEGLVAGVDGVPILTDVAAQWQREDETVRVRGGTSVTWNATPAADPDGLSILQIPDDATERDHATHLAETGSGWMFWAGDSRPAQVCPKVRQIDGKGVATAFSAPVCVDVEDVTPAGCQSTPAPLTGLGMLGALVSVLLRNRRR
ncbi:MAG: hypothetical protein V4850_35875 [Myxococcota bacterium]